MSMTMPPAGTLSSSPSASSTCSTTSESGRQSMTTSVPSPVIPGAGVNPSTPAISRMISADAS